MPRPRAGRQRPADFAQLGLWIAGRTTDLLAISILVGVVLVLAVRVSDWRQTATPSPVAGSASALVEPWDDPQGVNLHFGDAPWTIQRRTMHGSASQAAAAALAEARQIVIAGHATPLPARDDSEIDLLARLGNWAPLEVVDGYGTLYAIGGPLPWVVGITTGGAAATGPLRAGDDAAIADARVVCWALALPQPRGEWTLYVVDRRAQGDVSEGRLVEFPLPAGAHRALHIAGAAGGALICFSGDWPANRWRKEFDEIVRGTGWTRNGEWRVAADSAQALFRRQSESVARTAAITIVRGSGGRWRGIVDVTSSPTTNESGQTTESIE